MVISSLTLGVVTYNVAVCNRLVWPTLKRARGFVALALQVLLSCVVFWGAAA